MIDALLFSVRDNIRAAGFGYGVAECELTDTDGRPPTRIGNIFVSVYEKELRSTNDNCLLELYDFGVTLTMRVSVPLDRVGDQLLASKLARTGSKGNPSFNARIDQLRAFLHMNWTIGVLPNQTPPSANDNLISWCPPGTASVYGFIEPARYRGRDRPTLVGGEWFNSSPEAKDVGLKSEMRFEGAKRMQPETASVGPFI